MQKTLFLCLFAAILPFFAQAQYNFYEGMRFTHRDSLLGGSRAERYRFNVMHYDLTVKVNPERKYISGCNDISYRCSTSGATVMQLDLNQALHIDSISQGGKALSYERDAGAIFVTMPNGLKQGELYHIKVYFEGIPVEAKKAPWDGGFVWKKDNNKKDWIGMACEDDGASLWYPCKDDLSDEPDNGATMHIIVPEGLTAVSNGRLKGDKSLEKGLHQFDWEVKSTINNYNINFTVGDFVHFHDIYTAADGANLDLDYWVLRENLDKAKAHFEQVKPMLKIYEKYFGKYPFWNDSYKLIETPYVGMEHQSGIAYGNQYMPRYLGEVVPKEFDFDFIIIHESGHEYFGNALSCGDHAELWLHEAFTTYMEAIYIEETKGKDAAIRYLESQKAFIKNQEPMVGPRGVHYNRWPDSDMYYKGTWFLHTLRSVINDDKKFFEMLRKFYDDYKFKATGATTFDFQNTLQGYLPNTAYNIMYQYLNHPRIPTFVYSVKKPFFWFGAARLRYRYEANVYGFEMPIEVGCEGDMKRISPNGNIVREVRLSGKQAKNFKVATDKFLVEVRKDEKELKLPPKPKPAKPTKAAPKPAKK